MWGALTTVGLAGLIAMVVWQSTRPAKITELKGKAVWITGASSGIGEALARIFYEHGAKVILSSRDVSKLNNVRDACIAMENPTNIERVDPVVLQVDLTKIDTLQAKAEEAIAIFGQLDILCNNGGISQRSAVVQTDLSVDQNIMLVNFLGPVALTKAVLPHMISRRTGHIVVTSSLQGLVAIPYRASYAASKHALHGYFDSLRSEVAHEGVDITIVCPGYVKTNLSLNAMTGSGGRYGQMDATTAKGFEPEYVAEEIVDGMLDKEHTIVIADLKSRLAIYLRVLWPWLLYNQLLRMARAGVPIHRRSLSR